MRNKAIELINIQRYSEALGLLLELHDEGEKDENLIYLIGQCYRYMDDYSQAIHYLQIASQKKASATNLLAFGIALQLDEQYKNAIEIFNKAISVDQNYLLAYNSLAFTYKRMGDYQASSDTYERISTIMGYQIIYDMKNSRKNAFIESNFSGNSLWMQYAVSSAIYFSNEDGIQSIGWPSGESAEKEEREHNYEGLYWYDEEGSDGKVLRMFLPNYFNTFKKELTRDSMYATVTGNRGLVLELLGDMDEAEKHFNEADEFMQLYKHAISIQ